MENGIAKPTDLRVYQDVKKAVVEMYKNDQCHGLDPKNLFKCQMLDDILRETR